MELSNPFGMSRPALFLLLSTHSTPSINAFLPRPLSCLSTSSFFSFQGYLIQNYETIWFLKPSAPLLACCFLISYVVQEWGVIIINYTQDG